MPRLKALIVEDEFIIAEDIRQMLLSLTYDVVGIANKYSRAVELLQEKEVDIILLDIVLAGSKTGIDLAETINKDFNIPFIFLTSHADAATVKLAKAVKPKGYLLKPFTKDDLFTTLEIATFAQTTASPDITEKLSERERDVFTLLVEGQTDQEIADKLFVSLNTVKTHVKSIYKKLEVKNRLEAVTLAMKTSST